MTDANGTQVGGLIEYALLRDVYDRAVREERREDQRIEELMAKLNERKERAEQLRQLRRSAAALHPRLSAEAATANASQVDSAEEPTWRVTDRDAPAEDQPGNVPQLVRTVLQARRGEWMRPSQLAKELAYAMPHSKAPDAKIRRILRDLNEQDENVEVTDLDGRTKGYRWRASSADAIGADATHEEETA